ncbi:unnamed protein product [Cylicocyclus nassatus]|uniref:Uncharacterized protein n=1 Tax=Cylicocyclus nassatus TaxID=53992 RepID=A0AA36DRN7_CYLNA|nr:unnamed protein product [Cylicocyclus nassatus]
MASPATQHVQGKPHRIHFRWPSQEQTVNASKLDMVRPQGAKPVPRVLHKRDEPPVRPLTSKPKAEPTAEDLKNEVPLEREIVRIISEIVKRKTLKGSD